MDRPKLEDFKISKNASFEEKMDHALNNKYDEAFEKWRIYMGIKIVTIITINKSKFSFYCEKYGYELSLHFLNKEKEF